MLHDDATNNYFLADEYSPGHQVFAALNRAETIADDEADDEADLALSPRERDQAFAARLEAHARSDDDHDFTPYVSQAPVTAVSLVPGEIGREVENLGRKLRALPFFASPRAYERRHMADTYAAFVAAKDCAHMVYSAGFRTSLDPVPLDDFWREYTRLSAERPVIVAAAAKMGLSVSFIKLESVPRCGGALQDLHGQMDIIGPHLAAMEFRRWIREQYPTGWMSKRPRSPARLMGYLTKGACTVDEDSPDQWTPKYAYKLLRLLEGRSPKWLTRYGDFLRCPIAVAPHRAEAALKPKRKRAAPRDGEVVIRVGTKRDRRTNAVLPVVFVQGYKGSFDGLSTKYDLTEVLAWADTYYRQSISPASPNHTSNTANATTKQHVNSQQNRQITLYAEADDPIPF